MRKLKPETLLTARHSAVLCHRDSLFIEDSVACKYFNVIVAFLWTFLWSLCRLIPDFHKHFHELCWRLLKIVVRLLTKIAGVNMRQDDQMWWGKVWHQVIISFLEHSDSDITSHHCLSSQARAAINIGDTRTCLQSLWKLFYLVLFWVQEYLTCLC